MSTFWHNDADVHNVWCPKITVSIINDKTAFSSRGQRISISKNKVDQETDELRCIGSRCAAWIKNPENQKQGRCGFAFTAVMPIVVEADTETPAKTPEKPKKDKAKKEPTKKTKVETAAVEDDEDKDGDHPINDSDEVVQPPDNLPEVEVATPGAEEGNSQ